MVDIILSLAVLRRNAGKFPEYCKFFYLSATASYSTRWKRTIKKFTWACSFPFKRKFLKYDTLKTWQKNGIIATLKMSFNWTRSDVTLYNFLPDFKLSDSHEYEREQRLQGKNRKKTTMKRRIWATNSFSSLSEWRETIRK